MRDRFSKFFDIAALACVLLVIALPLYIDSDFFFPYIFSKAVAFRILVELLTAFVILRSLAVRNFFLAIDWLGIIFLLFLTSQYVSSLLGGDFYFSFWSYIERSEGLLFWTHLFLFFILLRNVLTTERRWTLLFEVFFAVAQIVAAIGLLQHFGVDFVNRSGGGGRIASTIGNASFLAGYLLFALFTGLLLAHRKKLRWWWLYYGAAIVLDLFIIFQSGTRGAYVGLLGALLVYALYIIISSRRKTLRTAALVSALVGVLVVAFLFMQRDTAWIQRSYVLQRLTNISLTDTTSQRRLMTWESAWKGFLDKPLLGWGLENFYIPFNKYFNPKIFEDPGAHTWFDRAHNIFLDHLLTGGIVGLVLFLLLLGYPLHMMWREIRKKDAAINPLHNNYAPLYLILACVAFVLQGFFVFESFPVYLGLALVLGYAGYCYSKPYRLSSSHPVAMIFSAAVLIAIPFIIYHVNIREIRASLAVIDGVQLESTSPNKAYDLVVRAIEYNTSGTQEYRRRLADVVASMIESGNVGNDLLKRYAARVDDELTKRIAENPNDVSNMLQLMRHHNLFHVLDASRLEMVESLGQKAIALSSARPQVYYELGYANFYQAERLQKAGDDEGAQGYVNRMIASFEKSIELNDRVVESYINVINSALILERIELAQKYYDLMEARAVPFKARPHLERMGSASINSKQYDWTVKIFTMLIELDLAVPNYYINLALAHAHLGENEKAIAIAESIKKFGPPYGDQSEAFIADVKSGKFKSIE